MDIVEILELNRRTAGTQNVFWQGAGFTLTSETSGIVVAPPFFSRLSQFIGFEVRPAEIGIKVAVAIPHDSDWLLKERGGNYIDYLNDPLPVSTEPMFTAMLAFQGALPVMSAQRWQKFENGQWQSSLVPVYYSPNELRERIVYWVGPIQFFLLLEDVEGATKPLVSEIRLGLKVPRDSVEYLLNYGLPTRLSVPVPFNRNVMPDITTGKAVVIPPNISKERIVKPYLMHPTGIVGATVRDTFIELDSPVLPARASVLCFDYIPLVENAGEIYQISDLPCVVLLDEGEENKYHIPGRVTILTKDGPKNWEGAYQFDQVVSVSVLGREDADIQAILDTLLHLLRVAETSYVECYPWGGVVAINLMSGVEGRSQIQATPGIKGKSFKVSLGKLIRGGRFS